MKSILLSTFLFLFSFVAFGQLTNAGFEDWTDNPVPSYSDPDGWTTLNSLSTVLGSPLVFKATASDEIHGGTAAAKMITAQLAVGITPGIITNGVIDAQSQSVIGGKPYSERPVVFGGWFRYDPANVDTGFVSVTLTRWDELNNVRETVGEASSDILSTNGQFENIELMIAYSSTETPDTVLIIMGPGDDIEPQVGSALFADDLYFSNSAAGIRTPESIGLQLFPNPALDVLHVRRDDNEPITSATVFSIDGKEVLTSPFGSTNAAMDVSGLKAGSYIIELHDAQGTIVRQRFLKN